MEKGDIIEIENQLIQGIKTSDVKLLDKLLHDDLLFIAPNGKTVTKEMDLASHRTGDMVVNELISKIEEINIIGDNAIVVVVYDTKGTMLGNTMQGQFRYTAFGKCFMTELKLLVEVALKFK